MKNRSRMDIVGNILATAMRGASKTKLMYGANLSYKQLKEYLVFAQQKKLIAMEGPTTYRLTPRGLQFLNVYEELKELLTTEPIELEVRARPETIEVQQSQYIPESFN